MQYVRNHFGIVIKKCCASCIHKQLQGKGAAVTRICDAGEGIIKPSALCQDWQMIPTLDNAGKGDGRVKCPQYIQYLRSKPIGGDTPVSVFRKEWLESGKQLYDNDFSKQI